MPTGTWADSGLHAHGDVGGLGITCPRGRGRSGRRRTRDYMSTRTWANSGLFGEPVLEFGDAGAADDDFFGCGDFEGYEQFAEGPDGYAVDSLVGYDELPVGSEEECGV